MTTKKIRPQKKAKMMKSSTLKKAKKYSITKIKGPKMMKTSAIKINRPNNLEKNDKSGPKLSKIL